MVALLQRTGARSYADLLYDRLADYCVGAGRTTPGRWLTSLIIVPRKCAQPKVWQVTMIEQELASP